ncbi:Glutathione S-transferase zeta-1 [Asimina triloba]
MASHSTSTYVVGEGSGERAKLQLYSYCRSSCSWRVRIALNLKGTIFRTETLNSTQSWVMAWFLPHHSPLLANSSCPQGLKYEYKAVNIYKGEQFNPGEHLGCTSITVPAESKLIIRYAPNEFLKLNPLGFVPVLVDDDVVVSDSFAIILYLEEKYPQHPLLPNDLQKRALNLQIANIVSSSIQPYQNISVLSYIEEKVSHDEQFSWAQNHIGKGFTGKLLSALAVLLAPTSIEKLLEGTAGKYATGDEVFLTKFPLLLKLNEAYDASPAFRAAMPDMQPDAVKV